MQNRMLNFFLSTLAAAFLSATAYARPADAPANAPANAPATAPAHNIRRDPGAILARIKEITGELKLTDDQQNKVDAIFEKVREEVKTAATSMQDATPREKAAKFREILGNLRDQLTGVLDETQKAELNDKLQALRQSVNPTTGPAGLRGPAGMVQRVKAALDKLDLNEDQKAKIDEVFKSAKAQIEDVHSQVVAGTLNRQDAQEKIRPLLEDARQKIIDQLTPDQADSLREMMQQGNKPGL